MSFFTSRSNTFNFVFLFLAAFFIRLFFIVFFKFDGLYGQDAYAYADWSNQFFNSVTSFQIPANFYWPIGFYLFTSLFGLLLGGNTDLAALLLNINAGALTAGFMYLLIYELFSTSKERKIPAIAAGLIICFAGVTVKSSIVIMADALGLLFLTISAYYFVVYIKKQKRINLVICFVFFSFGLMTRYADGLFLAVMLIVLIYSFGRSAVKKKAGTDLFLAVIAGLIIYMPQAYYLFKYGIAYFQFEGEHATWAASWNPLNIFSKDFFTFDGTMHYRLFNGLFYVSPSFHPMFLSLFGIAFIYGVYKAIKKRERFLLVFCIVWIAVYYLYYSGNPYQSIRYTMSFLPPLIIFAVYGLNESGINKIYKSIYAALCFILLAGYAYYDVEKHVQRKDMEFETIDWINKNIPQGAKLFTFEITGAVNHYSKRDAREIFNYSYKELVSSIDSSGNIAYMVIPVNKIKTQWKGLKLEKNYDSLQADYRLEKLGRINEFEGFKIEK